MCPRTADLALLALVFVGGVFYLFVCLSGYILVNPRLFGNATMAGLDSLDGRFEKSRVGAAVQFKFFLWPFLTIK